MHYDADESGVTVHFDQDQPSVRAKILIGADGYFSKTRKKCLNDGPPAFAVSAQRLFASLLGSIDVGTYAPYDALNNAGDAKHLQKS